MPLKVGDQASGEDVLRLDKSAIMLVLASVSLGVRMWGNKAKDPDASNWLHTQRDIVQRNPKRHPNLTIPNPFSTLWVGQTGPIKAYSPYTSMFEGCRARQTRGFKKRAALKA